MSEVRKCVDRGYWLLPRCRRDKCRHWTTLLVVKDLPEATRRTALIVSLCEGCEEELREVVARLLPSWAGTDAAELLAVARAVQES